ncbi:MAG: PAS domain S-box protein [Chitinophagaceae bacterium]|nr:MAG: PAS domain S-box protein [Chitinophagaceae bacterium]
MEVTPVPASHKFLQGGGFMGALIRDFDWASTPIGPVEQWPQALRSALSICLNAGFPIAIYWGPELVLLYNDAWSAIPGNKHPAVLGMAGADAWPDIWDTVGPQFQAVLRDGSSFRSTDQQLAMHRFGYTEETYFDYNLSPIFLPDGSVGGVFNAGIETTYQVVNERRNELLHRLQQRVNAARTEAAAWTAAIDVLGTMPIGLPYVLHYSAESQDEPRLRAATTPVPVPLAWPFREALLSGAPVLVATTPIAVPAGIWPEPCIQALLVPLRQGTGSGQHFLVFGISPRRRLDKGYQQFLESIALHISSALQRSRSVEQELSTRRQLEQSEENLRRLFMQAPMGICILRGPELYVELVNDAYLEIVQRERDRFEHRPLWEGLPEVKDQGFDMLLQNVRTTGEAFIGRDQPVQIRRNGAGETIYVDFVYEPLRGGTGGVDRIMALVIDVTDKVHAREEILKTGERARLAIQSAELGTFDVNLVTNEIVASPRLAEIMDIDHTDDRARYVSAIHPEDQTTRTDAYQRAYETGYLQYEGRVVWKDGSVHWMRVKGRVFFDEDGKPQQLLGVAQDITEIKDFAAELTRQVEERTQALQAANTELGRRNAELEQFAYVSSHDLQEPLRKIRLFTDAILGQEFDNLSPLSRSRFEKVVAATDRMSRSLRDLLEYASLERREEREPVNLNEVLEQVQTDLELMILQKEAVISAGPLPTLAAIPLQMQQLFYNLVNNALKYARPGVPVRVNISSTVRDGMHEIRVEDNGIGFEQQNAQKIFTIFQRLHDRNSYSGSGIGLALCKKVAENHGGSIRAEGRPGEGAVFVVTLPSPLSPKGGT